MKVKKDDEGFLELLNKNKDMADVEILKKNKKRGLKVDTDLKNNYNLFYYGKKKTGKRERFKSKI